MTASSSESRLQAVTLPGSAADGPLASEQQTALSDLTRESRFQPANDEHGPYDLQLSIEENRLVFRLTNAQGAALPVLGLSLSPYRRLVQDYFMMIQSYEDARRHASHEKLEAIDMARRGLHNEGADLLTERLKGKIDMDFETARRLFTLVCVLHKNFMIAT